MKEHPYLRFPGIIGTGLRPVALHGETCVALVGWQPDAFKLAARDRWIGRTGEPQFWHLHRIANPSRFILPDSRKTGERRIEAIGRRTSLGPEPARPDPCATRDSRTQGFLRVSAPFESPSGTTFRARNLISDGPPSGVSGGGRESLRVGDAARLGFGSSGRADAENRTPRGPPQRTGHPRRLRPAVPAGLPDGPPPRGLDPAGTRPHPLVAGDVDVPEIDLPGRRKSLRPRDGRRSAGLRLRPSRAGSPAGRGTAGGGSRRFAGRGLPTAPARSERRCREGAAFARRTRSPRHRFPPPAGGPGATLAAAGSGPSKEPAPHVTPIRPPARSPKRTGHYFGGLDGMTRVFQGLLRSEPRKSAISGPNRRNLVKHGPRGFRRSCATLGSSRIDGTP